MNKKDIQMLSEAYGIVSENGFEHLKGKEPGADAHENLHSDTENSEALRLLEDEGFFEKIADEAALVFNFNKAESVLRVVGDKKETMRLMNYRNNRFGYPDPDKDTIIKVLTSSELRWPLRYGPKSKKPEISEFMATLKQNDNQVTEGILGSVGKLMPGGMGFSMQTADNLMSGKGIKDSITGAAKDQIASGAQAAILALGITNPAIAAAVSPILTQVQQAAASGNPDALKSSLTSMIDAAASDPQAMKAIGNNISSAFAPKA